MGAKYKFANQEVDGFPLTIVGYNTVDINSELKKMKIYLDLNLKIDWLIPHNY